LSVVRFSILSAAIAALSLVVGCEEPQVKPLNPLPSVTAAAPADTFQRIVLDIRRAVLKNSNSTSAQMIAATAVGQPTVESTVEVQDKLLPSKATGEPDRATITIVTRSSVTTVNTDDQESDDDPKKPEKSTDQRREELQTKLGDAASQNLVESLAKRPSAGPGQGDAFTIDNEQTREFNLTHRAGRWELENPPERSSEPLLEYAFRYALSRQ
jgi:hypothetical protein